MCAINRVVHILYNQAYVMCASVKIVSAGVHVQCYVFIFDNHHDDCIAAKTTPTLAVAGMIAFWYHEMQKG